MQKDKIVLEPVNKVIKEIENANNSVFLAGAKNTGKTTVLNEYLSREDSSRLIVNGTTTHGEYYILIKDEKVYELYHTCLIIRKILLKLKVQYKDLFNPFMYFDAYIENILKQIKIMYMLKGDIDFTYIDADVYHNPETLLDELFGLLIKNFDIKSITVVLDNFDMVGDSSARYQQFMYMKLRQYLNLIMTVSDKNVLNNSDALEKLNEDNTVIRVDYSTNIDVIKEILDKEVLDILFKRQDVDLNKRLCFVLSDDIIRQMIEKTNGNIFDMFHAIRVLYSHLDELTKEEYGTFILKYIDEEINKSPIISGVTIQRRTLHIINN